MPEHPLLHYSILNCHSIRLRCIVTRSYHFIESASHTLDLTLSPFLLTSPPQAQKPLRKFQSNPLNTCILHRLMLRIALGLSNSNSLYGGQHRKSCTCQYEGPAVGQCPTWRVTWTMCLEVLRICTRRNPHSRGVMPLSDPKEVFKMRSRRKHGIQMMCPCISRSLWLFERRSGQPGFEGRAAREIQRTSNSTGTNGSHSYGSG